MTQGNFSFSGYEVFPVRNKVVLGNASFKLEPKVMDVFCLLVAQQGEVLSRDEIAQRLWPEKVVGLDVVTRAIFELRKLLNDDPKAPQFIETVARKGYCFLESVAIERQTSKSPKRNKPFHIAYSIFATSFVLVALFWYRQSDGLETSNAIEPYTQTVLTHQNLIVDDPTISQDGRNVTYIEASDNLYKKLVTLIPEHFGKAVVTGHRGNFKSPVFSSVLKLLYFVECATEGCLLKAINLETNSLITYGGLPNTVYAITLDKISETLAVNYREDNETKIGLFDIETSSFKPLELPSGRYMVPAFNLNSSGLWVASVEANFASKLYFFDFRKQKLELVSEAFHVIQSLAAGKDDTVWVAGKKSGESGIWNFNPKQNTSINATTFIGQFPSDLSTNDDGSKLVFKLTKRDTKIENLGIDQSFSELNSSAIDIRAAYNPVNESVYWVSNRTGSFELWQGKNGQKIKLSNFKANSLKQPVISRDGNRLAVLEKGERYASLHIFDLQLNSLKETIPWPYTSSPISWSDKNSAVLFELEGRLARLNLEKNTLTSLPINAAEFIQSENGKLIYYDTDKNAVVEQSGSITKTLIELNEYRFTLQPITLHLNSEFLLFMTKDKGQQQLIKYDRQTGTYSSVYTLPPNSVVTEVGSSPKPYVVYDRFHQDQTEIVMWKFD